MQNKHHYLRVNPNELWLQYGIIFVPYFSLFLVSEYSVVLATLWYWLVCGILFYLEYVGTYFLIQDKKLISVASFLHGKDIPVENIKELTVGQSEVAIFHPRGLKILFEDSFGKLSHRVLTFRRFGMKEMEKFIRDLHETNPRIIINKELQNWIEKKKEKAKKKKTISDFFDVD